MIHIFVGIAAIAWGLWRMLPDWMFFSEILKTLLFFCLVGFGVVAIAAGSRKLRANR